jgi:TetR/AcrR family fatty acid metabolism transcriptional regulator
LWVQGGAVPRLSAARLRDRYETILDAAEQVLGRGGFAEASVGEVARLAGVSDGLIYRYFDSKQALRDAVLARFYARILQGAQSAVAGHELFRDRLLALIETHLRSFRDERALCRLFIAEVRVAADYPGSPLQDLNRRYTGVLERVLRQGVLEGAVAPGFDPRLVRDMLYGVMEHVAWRSVNGRASLDVAGTARKILALLLGGLAATPA